MGVPVILSEYRDSLADADRPAAGMRGNRGGSFFLVERDEILGELGGLLTDADQGRGRLAIVDGPLGSGKSRLVHEFLESLEPAGARVLRATASLREHQLPCGVVTQLLHGMTIPSPDRDRMCALLSSAVEHTVTDGEFAGGDPQAHVLGVFQKLTVELARLAETTPLVICVDNAHYLDAPSLHFLAGMVPWLHRARILVLLTDDQTLRRPRTSVPARLLLRSPNALHLTLNLLSRNGVHTLATRLLGPHIATPRLTAELHGISGGNLLAVQTLIVDQQAGGATYPEGYGQALLDLVAHCRPSMLSVVRALAVLGGAAEVADVARLAGVGATVATEDLHALAGAGVLTERHAFRHPVAVTTVLEDMPADGRATLHRAAAELLHEAGAPALTVARQLMGAADPGIDCATEVLVAASREALTTGDVETARDCLDLARRTGTDGPTAAGIRAGLSRLEWQLTPQVAVRHLRTRLADFTAGHLDRLEISELVLGLAEAGALDELTTLLDTLRTRSHQGAAPGTEDIRPLTTWAAMAYPLHTGLRKLAHSVGAAAPEAAPCYDPWLPSALALADDLVRGRTDQLVHRAALLLGTFHLDHGSLWNAESATLALRALLHANRVDEVVAWCEKLEAEAADHHAVAWQGRFLALRAEAHLRQGRLTHAHDLAARALALVPPQGWGTGLAAVLGCAILAATRSGRLALAATYVAQPVPEQAVHSRYGTQYLHARGHYRLATHHPQAALADFLACGRLAETWDAAGVDTVPWRTSAAEAWLAQDDQEQAKRLVRDQMARLQPGLSRDRGLCLRTLAAVSRVNRRPQLLTEAVDLLKDSGCDYELARALIDLSTAFRDIGDQRNARRVAHRAWHLARQTGAEYLCREAGLDPVDPESVSSAKQRQDALPSLTMQERRIALLAVKGHTNREIAAKLYITASTVEQHLTRVFRKLNVKRRQELPYIL
ncbi:helix-turn-helix transcriptional regulator [Streptomyces sp. SBT349]|uniref:helix-turn-helix transcriptional regulator n=1 Tax=Streptomyces sp. SBT349 TaxID=1580539 RepID=UPI00131E00BC|nr:LuxR family transcriptional regulator [Streptomyces sp. SBT349]